MQYLTFIPYIYDSKCLFLSEWMHPCSLIRRNKCASKRKFLFDTSIIILILHFGVMGASDITITEKMASYVPEERHYFDSTTNEYYTPGVNFNHGENYNLAIRSTIPINRLENDKGLFMYKSETQQTHITLPELQYETDAQREIRVPRDLAINSAKNPSYLTPKDSPSTVLTNRGESTSLVPYHHTTTYSSNSNLIYSVKGKILCFVTYSLRNRYRAKIRIAIKIQP